MNSTQLKNHILDSTKKYELSDLEERILSLKEEDIDINVAFLGEFKSGKTTLINALLGTEFLPMFETPTTAVITEICKGEEDSYSVLRKDGKIEKIQISELAKEVKNISENQKIIITLKDIPFLDEKIKIVDTPGVNSIEEMHDDITFGYLPMIDVAFVLMNINIGTAPHSLIDFLKKYPKDMLSKMYFVVNYVDTKPKNKIDDIVKDFRKDLLEITDNPNLVVISAKRGLISKLNNDIEKYKQSGVSKIEKIIKEDIVESKKDVVEKRIYNKLNEEMSNLEKVLEEKLKSLSWETPELDEKIKDLNVDINNIEKDIREFKRNFDKIKNEIIEKLKIELTEIIKIISYKVSREEDITDDLNSMQETIKYILENGIKKIKDIKIEHINNNVAEIIKIAVKKGSTEIKEIADLINDIVTFALTVWIIKGPVKGKVDTIEAVGGGATIAAEKAGKLAKATKDLGKIAGFIGKIVKEINPIEKIEKVTLPYIMNPILKNKIVPKITNNVEYIFSEIGDKINEYIADNYLTKIKDKEQMLINAREEREKEEYNTDKLKKELENDLDKIRTLKNEKE